MSVHFPLGIDSAGNLTVLGTITANGGTWDSGGIDIASGDTYAIAGTDVLSATTLGSGVTASSLTSVGTLSTLTVSGDATFDTDTLFVDSSADSVGVFTASPTNFSGVSFSKILEVNGSLSVLNLRSSAINFGGATYRTAGIVSGTDAGGGILRFLTTSATDSSTTTERARFDSAGYLGVGTTSPNCKFHVEDLTDSATTFRIVHADNTTAGPSSLPTIGNADGTDNTYTGIGFDDGDNDGFAGRISCKLVDTSNNYGELYFGTRDASGISEKMAILGNGNVGIGVLTPESILHLGTATEELEIVDAGSTSATEQDWIEVQVGDNVGYIRVFATK
jgi:hypothetical protein